ncbi:MAG: RecX family transcriptional regulator [Deltaproteobacteria bacterium]|nr:RecX family transcriptional regulator [Deltaproteobacteria bacterium]
MTSRSSGSDPRDVALRALARGEKTRAELEALVARRSDAATARATVEQLAAAGLQSDQRAAEVRARQAHARGWTRERTLEDLTARAVAAEVARAAVDQVYAGDDPRAHLQAEARRLLGATPTRQQALKVARALVRRGHDPVDALAACGVDDEHGATAGDERD